MSDPGDLSPSSEPALTPDQALVRHLFKAFDDHSKRFWIDLIGVRPYLGDCKIMDRNDPHLSHLHDEIFVELKARHCQLRSGVLCHAIGIEERPIFCWTAQWDYILTISDDASRAFMIPRDRIPQDWWDTTKTAAAQTPKAFPLKMTECLEEYAVRFNKDATLVKNIEAIIDSTIRKTGSRKAQEPVPVDYSSPEPMLLGYKDPIAQIDRLESEYYPGRRKIFETLWFCQTHQYAR